MGHRYGKSFTIGEYSEGTSCTMFDMLNLPVDMIVTQSFTPINSNLMAGRIKRQKRQMQASQDAALSLMEALDIASKVTGNHVIENALLRAREAISVKASTPKRGSCSKFRDGAMTKRRRSAASP